MRMTTSAAIVAQSGAGGWTILPFDSRHARGPLTMRVGEAERDEIVPRRGTLRAAVAAEITLAPPSALSKACSRELTRSRGMQTCAALP